MESPSLRTLAAFLDFVQGLSAWQLALAGAVAVLCAAAAACLAGIALAESRVRRAQGDALRAFRQKLGKVPALVMALRDHLYVPDEVFKVMVALYADAVLREFQDPYSLMEANARVQHEVQFIMTVANKHHKVNLDGNFLYVRDFLIRHETELRACAREMARAAAQRNRLWRWKNRLLAGLPFPPYAAMPEIAA